MTTAGRKLGAGSSRRGVLKTTKSGRPFARNLLDIYAAFALALPLHRTYRWFTRYEDVFVFDDALRVLANLKVLQRLTGPQAPTEPGTTAVKTLTYNLVPDSAHRLCELFMAARLIADVTDPRSRTFVHAGVYVLTPKGLHIAEQFVARSGGSSVIAESQLTQAAAHAAAASLAQSSDSPMESAALRLLAVQPVCPTLLHLVRGWDDDEVVMSADVVRAAFRWFLGRATKDGQMFATDETGKYKQHASGVQAEMCFRAADAVDRLLDHTSLLGPDEAGKLLAHCVRLGLLEAAHLGERKRKTTKVYTATAQGGAEEGMQATGEFVLSPKAVYRLTEEGRRVAGELEGDQLDVPLLTSGYSTPSALPRSEEERLGGVYMTTREVGTAE